MRLTCLGFSEILLDGFLYNLYSDVYGAQKVTPNDFGNPRTFPPVKYFIIYQMD